MGKRSARPVLCRSSVTSAIPAATASRGDADARRAAVHEDLARVDGIHAENRAARFRPARRRSSPASPTISPARSEKRDVTQRAAARQPFDAQQLRARRDRLRAGRSDTISRPTMCWMMRSVETSASGPL